MTAARGSRCCGSPTPTALRHWRSARVQVYERPAPFAAMTPGRVVVLNGPSSVGKSATMAAFVAQQPTPWACIDEPIFGRLDGRFLAWPATAGPVADAFLAALGAAVHAGMPAIVSAGGIAQSRSRAALVDVPVVYVGLHAPLAVLVQRQVQQADKFGGLAEESVGIHDGWVYDLEIDTAGCDPGAAAGAIATLLAGGPALA